ncbi:MAG: hypothetical protein IAA81_00045 [Spirochaetes bacterium]|uniref:Uncharacterized protein n=1 Tax=Candidatus Gallitreponema excrementavium TaxID=2840840 RepID=A0A9D9N169_9SPIR|nr:hypothetical protein [Candidatus Gallitreponema excrementavium]
MSKKLGILVLVIAIIVFGLNNFRELTVWILASLGKILLVAAVVIAIVNVVYYLFFDNNVENFKTPARMIALTGILVILWWFGISFFGFPMWIPVSVWGGLTVLVTAGIALIYRHDKVSLDKKEKMENEEEETDSEKRNDELEDKQNAERAKLLERYNAVMPRVKKYLNSVGFTLPENENLFFMEIDESNGKWKFQSYEEAVDDEFFKDTTYPRASGILLTPEKKAYIGAPNEDIFSWYTEDGNWLDDFYQARTSGFSIDNVLAVGNITDQLLCGDHFADEYEYVDEDGNDIEGEKDFYYYDKFPLSVKRVFVLPSEDLEKNNTVTLGGIFDECNNIQLFFCGFNKVVREKLITEDDFYAAFPDNSRGTFICPSVECAAGIREWKGCMKKWDIKIGSTITNGVPLEDEKPPR